MIAPLRRRHRLTVASLAVALPVLYVVALAARPDEPVAQLPAALAAMPAGEVDQDFGELFSDPAVAVRSRTDGTDWWVELDPQAPIALPEVLVYWTPTSAPADRLPEDAYLIGSLAGARARAHGMPRDALGRDGTLVLYSLGHQDVVASAPLPAIGTIPVRDESPKVDFELASGESAEPVP